MKKSELETMRKSFNKVKSRSNSIKDSESTKRLTKRVQEIKKYSFENKDELFNQVIDSFKRNGIEVEFAKTSQDALDIIDGLIDEYDAEVIAKAKSNTLGEIDLKIIWTSMLWKRIWETAYCSLKRLTTSRFIQQALLHI